MSTALALDAAGRPHIAYACAPAGEAAPPRYAYYDGSAWLTATISPDPAVGRIALDLDFQDRPHVAFSSLSGEEVYVEYAWREGAAWRHERVARSGGGEEQSAVALVVDVAGRPHIAYPGAGPGDAVPTLDYGHRMEAGRWVTETVEHGSGVYPSLALDAAGWPRIGYGRSVSSDIRYAWNDGAGWQIETVPAGRAQYPALVLTPSGEPALVYYGLSAEGAIMYASRDATGWHPLTLAPLSGSAVLAGDSAIAADALGRVHVAYFDWNTWDLVYGRRYERQSVYFPILLRPR
jgi:hypothetical protein